MSSILILSIKFFTFKNSYWSEVEGHIFEINIYVFLDLPVKSGEIQVIFSLILESSYNFFTVVLRLSSQRGKQLSLIIHYYDFLNIKIWYQRTVKIKRISVKYSNHHICQLGITKVRAKDQFDSVGRSWAHLPKKYMQTTTTYRANSLWKWPKD